MYRYTLFIPEVDNEGVWRPEFREYVGDLLLDFGFEAWTERPSGTGVWRGRPETVTEFVIDTDEPYAEEKLMTIAARFRDFALQEAVYFSRERIEAFLVTRAAEPEAVTA